MTEALRTRLYDQFRGRAAADAIGREAAHVAASLADAVAVAPATPAGPPHAATRHLGAALAGPWPANAHVLLETLRDAAHDLSWRYSYPPRADAPNLGDDIAFAELVGPRGRLAGAAVRVGLTLIGPHVSYPAHRHPAVELYLVLSGTATWTGPGGTVQRPPGDWLLHECNAPHAMQTGADPLLALYSWSGDVVSPSVYLN